MSKEHGSESREYWLFSDKTLALEQNIRLAINNNDDDYDDADRTNIERGG